MEASKPKRNYILLTLQVAVVVAVLGYLTFVLTDIANRPATSVCEKVEIKIMDSTQAGFISREEVERILEKKNLRLTGRKMEDINSATVQKTLLKNTFISEATCYKTPDGRFNILISQRLPVMRVMAADGADYYMDAHGKIMNPMGYSADLVVATGHISKSFAKDSLLTLGIFLRDNDFWNDQIEQIDVRKDGSIDLVPRVGSGLLHVGDVSNLDTKFRNLRALYEKVFPTIGWNKYASINLEHTNQIICKKKKK